MRNLLNKLVSPMAVKIVCCILVLASAISAVSDGIEGKYSGMHNHINWVIWISLVVGLIVTVEKRNEEVEVKDSYIKALEEYKVLTEEHIVGLKDLIEAHKTRSEGLEEQIETHKKLNDINEKIIEGYKNHKPSRF
jgi:hypothetical protein